MTPCNDELAPNGVWAASSNGVWAAVPNGVWAAVLRARDLHLPNLLEVVRSALISIPARIA